MLRILLIILVALAVIIGLMKLTGSRPADAVQSVQDNANSDGKPESLPQENTGGDGTLAGEAVGGAESVEIGASEDGIEGPAIAIEGADQAPASDAEAVTDTPPAEDTEAGSPDQ